LFSPRVKDTNRLSLVPSLFFLMDTSFLHSEAWVSSPHVVKLSFSDFPLHKSGSLPVRDLWTVRRLWDADFSLSRYPLYSSLFVRLLFPFELDARDETRFLPDNIFCLHLTDRVVSWFLLPPGPF